MRKSRLKTAATLALNSAEDILVIVHEDALFHLTKPITLDVYQEGQLWVHEYKPLGIIAYAATQEESLRDFAGEFASCWRWVAEESDSNLGPDAKRLKNKLRDLVAKIEPANEFFPH